MKKIKKVAMAALMLASITSTVAFASGDSCSFTYANANGYGELSVNWSAWGTDKATAETTYGSTAYYAATYIQAVESDDSILDSAYDYGYSSVSCKASSTGVYRFNSTHGVVSSSNAWKWLKSATCTDW